MASVSARVSILDEQLSLVTERVTAVSSHVDQHDIDIEIIRADVKEHAAAWGSVKHELRRELVTLRRLVLCGSVILVIVLFRILSI